MEGLDHLPAFQRPLKTFKAIASIVKITETSSIQFPRLGSSYLEISRLQAAKHTFRIIRLLNSLQSFPILLSIPRKNVLADIRIILINILMMQDHLLGSYSDAIDDILVRCLACMVIFSVVPLEVHSQDFSQVSYQPEFSTFDIR